MSPVVHVVDDDDSFRRTVSRLLRACHYEVKEYASAQQFLECPTMAPGCILLDVQMPQITGLELQDRLAAEGSVLPILFLTGHGDIATSVRTMKAGAEDFLEKPVKKTKLLEAIERAFARSRQTCEKQFQNKANQALLNKLSPRERQVLTLVVAGKLNKQIANDLGATERTIKAHRHNMMDKLNVRSMVELLVLVAQPPFRTSIANREADLAAPEPE